MRVCVFNGTDRNDIVEKEIIENLKSYETTHLNLKDMNIGYCRCCNGCSKTGVCVQKDDGLKVVEEYKKSDVIVFFTRIRYGTYSKELKKAIDRLLPIGSAFLKIKEGYMIHRMLYPGKKLVAIGIMDESNQEEIDSFKAVVKANYINFDSSNYNILVVNNSELDNQNNINSFIKEVI